MIELHERLLGHRTIDFDRRKLRKAVRAGAALVRREGRKLAGKKKGAGRRYRVWGDFLHRASAPGSPPAKLTGALQRSIYYRTLDKDGLSMSVGPAPRRIFYARFLAFGTEKMEARPFMDEALHRHEEPIRKLLRSALRDSLVPR
ncbi:HK97-gp10 family putative phage morphogenesis protein [Azospirillum tabaci]|uniref:HK97-gp10 family putative phage morphogenesis protein n=1 Tax=Azospirillum tabaci TaxID=2752310 RepID=UPI0016604A7A|nr:HK97-gp10 family putative phage morphogenesis protein [Azospirillum tabaci]